MQRIGTVVGKQEQGVMVKFERPAACTGCGACPRNQPTRTVFALGEAQVGDIVSVHLPEQKQHRKAALTYLVPLTGFLLGLLAGFFISKQEAVLVGSAFLGLLLFSGALFLWDRKKGQEAVDPARLLLVNDPKVMAAFERFNTCPKSTSFSG